MNVTSKKKKNCSIVTEKGRIDTLTGVWWCFDTMSLLFVLHQIAHTYARKYLPLVALTFELITELSLILEASI